jgi:hypothetical protein
LNEKTWSYFMERWDRPPASNEIRGDGWRGFIRGRSKPEGVIDWATTTSAREFKKRRKNGD